jgi:hypothetical protein
MNYPVIFVLIAIPIAWAIMAYVSYGFKLEEYAHALTTHDGYNAKKPTLNSSLIIVPLLIILEIILVLTGVISIW